VGVPTLADSLLSDLQAHLSGDPNPRSTGIGATTPWPYAQVKARVQFLQALHRLVPRATAELLTDEACDLMRQWGIVVSQVEGDQELLFRAVERARTAEEALLALQRDLESPAREELRRVTALRDAHIEAWQERFHLTDAWVTEAALATLAVAQQFRGEGVTYDGPLLLSYEDLRVTPHEGKVVSVEAKGGTPVNADPSQHVHVPVTLDELKFADALSGWDGLFGTFDPRTESVEDGVARILPGLESRLRMLLTSLVLEDMLKQGAMKTKTLRTTKSFERLVRFQVMGKDLPVIARAERLKEGTKGRLSRDINETARLIGLTLRDKNKGGKPKTKSGRSIPLP
jgi:Txe/YoeB family toxin of Txe-Axe toxin-antitoxin module